MSSHPTLYLLFLIKLWVMVTGLFGWTSPVQLALVSVLYISYSNCITSRIQLTEFCKRDALYSLSAKNVAKLNGTLAGPYKHSYIV